ncbi:hypothetical protein SFC65_19300 [Priestia filamentosa]|uniref:hypothetical protein n=1 Tax=Priestia filamentosa TaxID=1402861 RepID=UPI003981C7B8
MYLQLALALALSIGAVSFFSEASSTETNTQNQPADLESEIVGGEEKATESTKKEQAAEKDEKVETTPAKETQQEQATKEEKKAKKEAETETVPEVVTEEPEEKMYDWPELSYEEKKIVVEKSLKYDKYLKETEGTAKTEVKGTVDDFIKVLDERYAEIENLEGLEGTRMSMASIYSQVDIMGHSKNLIEFVY